MQYAARRAPVNRRVGNPLHSRVLHNRTHRGFARNAEEKLSCESAAYGDFFAPFFPLPDARYATCRSDRHQEGTQAQGESIQDFTE